MTILERLFFSLFLWVWRKLRDPIKADFTENIANFHDFILSYSWRQAVWKLFISVCGIVMFFHLVWLGRDNVLQIFHISVYIRRQEFKLVMHSRWGSYQADTGLLWTIRWRPFSGDHIWYDGGSSLTTALQYFLSFLISDHIIYLVQSNHFLRCKHFKEWSHLIRSYLVVEILNP